jgi:hypothetical protein
MQEISNVPYVLSKIKDLIHKKTKIYYLVYYGYQ